MYRWSAMRILLLQWSEGILCILDKILCKAYHIYSILRGKEDFNICLMRVSRRDFR